MSTTQNPLTSQPANQHARKHGAYSDSIAFTTLDEKQAYQAMLDGFLAAWNPANEVELCAVHELAGCQLWFQRLEKVDQQIWFLGLQAVIDNRRERNWTNLERFAEYEVLERQPETQRELNRRRRHVIGRYNRALRELTLSRNERFAKDKAAARAEEEKAKAERAEHQRREKAQKEADRLEHKAAQEARETPAATSPQPVDSATQSVSAAAEAPPPATL